MEDGRAALERRVVGPRREQVAAVDNLDPWQGVQVVDAVLSAPGVRVPDAGAHLISLEHEFPDHVSAGETGAAGDRHGAVEG